MTDLRTIRAVVFDLDGLMFDTEALFFRVASEMLRDRGKVFTVEIMRAMIGRQPAESGLAFQTMAGLDETPEALMAEAKRRFEALIDTAVHPMPGLIALLDHLREARPPAGGRHVVGPGLCRAALARARAPRPVRVRPLPRGRDPAQARPRDLPDGRRSVRARARRGARPGGHADRPGRREGRRDVRRRRAARPQPGSRPRRGRPDRPVARRPGPASSGSRLERSEAPR